MNKYLSLILAVSMGMLNACSFLGTSLLSGSDPIDMKRIEKTQAYGYFAVMNTIVGDYNVEIKLASTKTLLFADMQTMDKHGYTTAIRVSQLPNLGLYILAVKRIDNHGQNVGMVEYSFQKVEDMYAVTPFLKDIPLAQVADYLVSLRSAECQEKDFVEFDDWQFLNRCRIDKGQYLVKEWVNYDAGLYFPKEFTFTNMWGENQSFITNGANALDKKQIMMIKEQEITLNREITEDMRKGKIEPASDLNEVKVKLHALASDTVL